MTAPIRPWPWPGDSREDRAKRVALSYRGLVQRICDGRCDKPATDLERLDQHWADLGVHWPVPSTAPIDVDDWVPARDAAHLADRSPRDIYDWARRGHIRQRIEHDGSSVYCVGDIIGYMKQRRTIRGMP